MSGSTDQVKPGRKALSCADQPHQLLGQRVCAPTGGTHDRDDDGGDGARAAARRRGASVQPLPQARHRRGGHPRYVRRPAASARPGRGDQSQPGRLPPQARAVRACTREQLPGQDRGRGQQVLRLHVRLHRHHDRHRVLAVRRQHHRVRQDAVAAAADHPEPAAAVHHGLTAGQRQPGAGCQRQARHRRSRDADCAARDGQAATGHPAGTGQGAGHARPLRQRRHAGPEARDPGHREPDPGGRRRRRACPA